MNTQSPTSSVTTTSFQYRHSSKPLIFTFGCVTIDTVGILSVGRTSEADTVVAVTSAPLAAATSIEDRASTPVALVETVSYVNTPSLRIFSYIGAHCIVTRRNSTSRMLASTSEEHCKSKALATSASEEHCKPTLLVVSTSKEHRMSTPLAATTSTPLVSSASIENLSFYFRATATYTLH